MHRTLIVLLLIPSSTFAAEPLDSLIRTLQQQTAEREAAPAPQPIQRAVPPAKTVNPLIRDLGVAESEHFTVLCKPGTWLADRMAAVAESERFDEFTHIHIVIADVEPEIKAVLCGPGRFNRGDNRVWIRCREADAEQQVRKAVRDLMRLAQDGDGRGDDRTKRTTPE